MESTESKTSIKTVVQTFYNSVNQHLNHSGFGQYSTFLNWGYVPDGSPEFSAIELPKRCLNKNCLKLILELVGDVDLNGRDVLEVGCGRGGNIQALNRFFKVKSFTGLDITPASIAFCKENLANERCHFIQEDAENLPFVDESFDVVINVESSNAYPDIEKFYDRVSRVLKTQGYFLYTDILKTEKFPAYLDYLKHQGLELEIDRDITPNVLLSRQELGDVQMKSFGLSSEILSPDSSPVEQEVFEGFLAPEDSDFFQKIKAGKFQYRMFRFRKEV